MTNKRLTEPFIVDVDETGRGAFLVDGLFTNKEIFFGTESEIRDLCDEINKVVGWLYGYLTSPDCASDWIATEDMLPDRNGAYLVVRDGGIKSWVGLFELCTECEMYGRWYWPRANGKRDEQMFTVTHWRPLLDPPVTICGHPVKTSEDIPEDTIIVTDGKYRVEITNFGEADEKKR